MNETELLLSDEFAAFTAKIGVLHNEKKQLEVEFRKLFDDYKAKKVNIEKQAKEATDEWEDWKARQLGTKE